MSLITITKALSDNTHAAILVFDDDKFIGAGGVSYFRVMPTYNNPTGEKAYIMNMYTSPEYRRRALHIKLLICL